MLLSSLRQTSLVFVACVVSPEVQGRGFHCVCFGVCSGWCQSGVCCFEHLGLLRPRLFILLDSTLFCLVLFLIPGRCVLPGTLVLGI
jgi:hypothetical protein